MKTSNWKSTLSVLAGVVALSAWALPAQAEAPKKGGILKFVVPDEPPSFDGHKETTFALIHPIAPFYSTLIRANPEDPAKNDFVCDLCTRDAEGSRRRQDLRLQDPQGRQVPRRHAAHRQRRVTPASSASSSRRKASRARARSSSAWSRA